MLSHFYIFFSFTFVFIIISFKIIALYLIITNIINFGFKHGLFPLNTKTQHYTFSKGKKPNSALNVFKFLVLVTCRNCQQGLQPDLFSEVYLYLEF
jgi:hypothetical protein